MIYYVIGDSEEKADDFWISLIVGLLFGTGLIVSGMSRRTKVLNFLTLNKNWDPSLAVLI